MDVPTRYRESQEPSTLYLIFTNEDYMVDNLRSCAPLGKSHHVGLACTFQIYTGVYSRPGKSKVYDYMKGDYESMKRELELLDWESEMDGKSVDRMWSCFKSTLYAVRDKYIKEKKNNRPSPKPPGIRNTIQRAVKKKYWPWKRVELTGRNREYKEYKAQVKEQDKKRGIKKI